MITYLNNPIEIKNLLRRANKQIKKSGKCFLTDGDYEFFLGRLKELDPETDLDVIDQREDYN